MRSVADALRNELRAKVAALTPDARVTLALRLGDDDLAVFCAAQRLDRRAAVRLLERRRQATRRPAACLENLLR